MNINALDPPHFSSISARFPSVREEDLTAMEANSRTVAGPEASDQELSTIEEGFCSTSLFRNSLCCYSCFGRRHPSADDGSDFWERIRTTQIKTAESSSFWGRGLIAFQKIREWSELVAGPRWKTFIRRFNRSRTGTACRHGKFQYDPLSYALNFDEGFGQSGGGVGVDDGDDYVGFRSFSVRFAAVPGTVKAADGARTEVRKDAAVLG